MRKAIISLLLIAVSFSLHAQLKVAYNGNVTVSQTTENPYSLLSVDKSGTTFSTGYNIAVNCGTAFASGNFNIGLFSGSSSSTPQSFGRTFGVLASAGNGANGYNYGVYGRLRGSNNGAAIVGTLSENMGFNITGKYAGYFDGDIYVTGSVMGPNIVTLSDIRLADNITLLRDEARTQDEILTRIMDVNVIKYNYIGAPTEESDTAEVSQRQISGNKQLHYGISAQELQQVFPDLVQEGQDGYLNVNYVEMVPILIRSIQELKQKIDELDDYDGGESAMSRTATAVSSSSTTGNVLYQNSPNPFNQQTTIRFSLSDNATNAAICIFDMNGKMLKKLPVSSGMNSVTISAYEFGEGMFLYSFMCSGREIDTKRMIITK